MEDAMEYVERVPLPEVCLGCEDRAGCLARGEGEWCCEECEHLLERFVCVESRAETDT
jgi:hypothetical protein